MILPYVYRMIHKVTKRFYIGFRCANKHPPEQDLGVRYFTSSGTVKKAFAEYDVEILAVFFDKAAAYEFEQATIAENFNDVLIINTHWQRGGAFTMAGSHRPDFAAYNKQTKSKPKEMREYICPECNNNFTREEFCHHPVRNNPTCSHSCNGKRNARNRPSCRGVKLGPRPEGFQAWNKGMPNPHSAEHGKRGAAKQAATKLGRKKVWNDDGSWIWTKPGDVRHPETKTGAQSSC